MAMNKVKINSDVELKDRLVAINRVTKVTKGGRTFTFAAIVVVGDGNGIIGWGLGKAGEVTAAIAKGVEAAKKNLVKVPVLKGTIPHEMESRFRGSQVFLKRAKPSSSRRPWRTAASATASALFFWYARRGRRNTPPTSLRTRACLSALWRARIS